VRGGSGGAGGHRFSRRRLLALGGVGTAAVAVAGLELASHGVVPGQQFLDSIDGACSLPRSTFEFGPIGPSLTGRFFSSERRRFVGYTIGYPPGHRPGDPLALVIMLHGFGGDHTNALSGMSPAQAVALEPDGTPVAPLAMVTVDGGGGYWNPHPHDNPMGMVTDELIPMCQAMGLGAPPNSIGTMGTSMGGYGALLLAEQYPHLIRAVAAISPAIWTSYDQARAANAGAYASARDFEDCDAVTHARALAGTPVRIASGDRDPFHPGVAALATALPSGAVVEFSKGCHDGAFFDQQEPPSLAFLGRHLADAPGG
jgi:pimeloyl-ACP methyl ester carboxylesterase